MIIGRLIKLFLLCLAFSSCTERNEVSFLNEEGNFNNEWQFVKDPVDTISPQLFKKNNRQEPGWMNVNLPHTSNIEPVDSSGKQWQGIAWYRKFFVISKEFEGKSVSLQFGAAMQVAKIYLNGELIQIHSGGYLPFQVKLDGKIRFGKQNCILIELDNRDNPLVPPGKPLAELDFNYYSGLYRNVTLAVKNKLHLSDPVAAGRVSGGGLMVSFTEVTSGSATINLQADVENEYTNAMETSLQFCLKDPQGRNVYSGGVSGQIVEASGFGRFSHQIKIDNPKLWSPESPALYKLYLMVLNKNQPVDSVSETIGIRTFSISVENGFVLNGQKLKIRGTNRHQEYPYIGNALSDNAQYRDAFKIKQAGFNFVRCSHYPQSPAFLKACDELGIMVMDPTPGWQFYGNEEFQNNVLSDIRQMVRRDRNHPSIILWEASLNETGMPGQFIEQAHQAVHEELPFPDVYTCGWIDDVYDVFIPARQHANPPYYWNRYDKDMPFLIAEYGDWEYYAQNAGFNQTAFSGLKSEERSSRQLRGFGQKRLAQQALNYQESHNDNLNGRMIGDANWLMFDYKRGYAPDIESSGIMDIFRIPKFAFYFYKSQQDKSEPVIFIANYWNDTSYKDVKVYSNCEEVELSLNSKVISRQKPDRDAYSTNLDHPPFTFIIPEFIAGSLVARGFNAGNEVIKTERKTPGKTIKIGLSVDLSGKDLEPGKNDIVFVYASVMDSDGIIIPDDERAVSFSVEGDAELVGDNPRDAEAGISTILLKAGNKPGIIKVKATSEGLIPGEMEVDVK
jgi:beta-galactosidase